MPSTNHSIPRFSASGFGFGLPALVTVLLLCTPAFVQARSTSPDTAEAPQMGHNTAAAAMPARHKTVEVSSHNEFIKALRDLQPGTTLLLAPGTYRSFSLHGVQGTAQAPIVIAGRDPDDPPFFTGRGEGAKLSSVAFIRLRSLKFIGFGQNGINIDDSGNPNTPSHHIVLEDLAILDTGPQGNHDPLKLSGVQDFVVRACRFEGWGGSGIDMVGCHRGLVEDCRFIGREGFRTKTAVQIKGGSSSILVQTSFFENAGERVIQIGGSTGPAYFRPPNAPYEARDIIVAGNRMVGGEAHVAWVTCQDTHVHHNLFYLPGKWLARILQESQKDRFVACQGGLFERNLVVTDSLVKVFVNIGRGTRPETFTFHRNAWYGLGTSARPDLPTPEMDGIHGVDPHIENANSPSMRIGSKDPALQGIGPDAYTPWRPQEEFADVNVPSPTRLAPPPTPRAQWKPYTSYALLGVLVLVALTIRRVLRSRQRNARG
jgi:hypothetical protein